MMHEDNENRLYSDKLTESKSAPTPRELELSALRFALYVKRLYERTEIASGPGQLILQHLLQSSEAITELIQKATAQRNFAKAQKMYAEVVQHIHKIAHWLNQMENNGQITMAEARPILDAGGVLAANMTAMYTPPPKPEAGLGEKDLTGI